MFLFSGSVIFLSIAENDDVKFNNIQYATASKTYVEPFYSQILQQAKYLDYIDSVTNIDSVFSYVPYLEYERKEKYFCILANIAIHKNNVSDTSVVNYFTTPVLSGTDSNVAISIFYNRLQIHIATAHTHTPPTYAAPSAKDLYYLVTSYKEDYHHAQNFVVGIYGDKYAIKISDSVKALNFLRTEVDYVAGSSWKNGSKIEWAFSQAYNYFVKNIYKGQFNAENLAYEMAMSAVMTEFKTGITLYKRNDQKKYYPIVVKSENDPFSLGKKVYTQVCF